MKDLLPVILLVSVFMLTGCTGSRTIEENKNDTTTSMTTYQEQHRPQLHFSPKEKWMNDPNGMVFHDGEYHLFYQYFPEGNTWGPMHWGHAISTDLVHWKHFPIALYPDSLGYIFSGSAVVDKQNTSGFGTADKPPLVAIFTYHSAEKEKAGDSDYQTQGIAYSIDNGRTWKKYEHNPVIENQGIRDFRDPKVFWHDESNKWVMILAVKDHVELWQSGDLKKWSKLSEFGSEYGSHGGVWECPDLFKVKIDGSSEEKWVMLVSINPGGPNGGSATQYFTGSFDGTTFTPLEGKNDVKWIDYGPDNYAGVTWSNTAGNRDIFLGWMSNWAYAEKVPTTIWRSASTLPRDLFLADINNSLYVRSELSSEVASLISDSTVIGSIAIKDSVSFNERGVADISMASISGRIEAKDFSLQLFNNVGNKLIIGFDSKTNVFFIDRNLSGRTDFSENFLGKITAPRISADGFITFTIIVDVSSVEVFFDDGLSVMTAIYFPDQVLSQARLSAPSAVNADSVVIRKLTSVWK